MQIGDKLKTLRLQKRMTLVELSEKAGVSKSLLSRIERNHSVPTITTLQKIDTGLGTDLSSFFANHEAEDPAASSDRRELPMASGNQPPDFAFSKNGNESKAVSVVRGDQRKKLIMPWGAHYEMLCPDMQHKIEFIYLHYHVGAKAEESYSHEGEECGLILEGTFKAFIGDQEIVLGPGDSIYFNSQIPHRWENAGDGEVKAIWAITPPSF
jgi:transcriptional regulator with XRE-family HTH domain